MIYDVCELTNKKGNKFNKKLAHILYDSDTKEFIIGKVGKSIPLIEDLQKKFDLQETKYKTLKADFDFCGSADYILYKIKDGFSFKGITKDISLCLVLNFPYETSSSDFSCIIDFLYTIGGAKSSSSICNFQIPSAFFPCIDSFSKEIDDKMNSYLVDLCYWALVSANVKLGVDIDSIHEKTELLSTGKRFNNPFIRSLDTGRVRVTGYLTEHTLFKTMHHDEHINQPHIDSTISNIDSTSRI